MISLKQWVPRPVKRWIKETNPVARLYRGRRRISSRPTFMNVEVTTHCDLACIMCPHDALPPSEIGHMPIELFTQVVDEARAFPGIALYLFGLGDPLLYPYLPEAIDHVRSRLPSSDIVLDTNGRLLDACATDSVLASDRVLISLNAGSADSYLWLTGRDDYDAVAARVNEFLMLRRESRRYQETGKPFVYVQFLETSRTRHELQAFRQRWEELLDGGGAVNVKRLTNWGGLIDPLSLGQSAEVARRYPCIYLWQSLAVDIHGNVYPCCEALGRRSGSELRLGNIRDSSLSAAHSSACLAGAREANLTGCFDVISDCSRCDIYTCHPNVWFNLPIAIRGRRWY